MAAISPRDRLCEPALPRWEYFFHQADIVIRGIAPTLEMACEQTGITLITVITVITDPARVTSQERVEINREAPDKELLFIDWLNALIYEMVTRRLLFSRYAVSFADHRLSGQAWGERIDRQRHQPAVEIKGATYTALQVRRDKQGLWHARCPLWLWFPHRWRGRLQS